MQEHAAGPLLIFLPDYGARQQSDIAIGSLTNTLFLSSPSPIFPFFFPGVT